MKHLAHQLGRALTISMTLFVGACASDVSRVQLWQQGKEDFDLSHNYAMDSTEVPLSQSYVKVHQEGFVVAKPFPVLYYSDKWIEVNTVTFETITVMSLADFNKVSSLASQQECTSSVGSEEGFIVVSGRVSNSEIYCRLNKAEACSFLENLKRLNFVHEFSYNFGNVDELQARLQCQMG
jgi:hypothetical protein